MHDARRLVMQIGDTQEKESQPEASRHDVLREWVRIPTAAGAEIGMTWRTTEALNPFNVAGVRAKDFPRGPKHPGIVPGETNGRKRSNKALR
ncbi:hypothetical protein EYF80_021733 [Liparis tanakae]|uniref:Uncharacterized protein n=1 Tax=Liparis tanakae TaxID=230148 RepID=A0A4Z2HQR0_9TELE|nr:hypothetical protein EYF80_021733 [Liparis tanakae]